MTHSRSGRLAWLATLAVVGGPLAWFCWGNPVPLQHASAQRPAELTAEPADSPTPATASSAVATEAAVEASAAVDAPAAPLPAMPGEQAVLQAVGAIEQQSGLTARLRHEVRLFGRQLRGEGLYQQGTDLRMRLELRMALDSQQPPAVLLQVCDGLALWEYRDVTGKRQAKRIAVDKVLTAVNQAPPATDPNGVRFLGLGGLPQLLRTLAHDFDFQPTVNSPDGRSVVVTGKWKAAALAPLLPEKYRQFTPEAPPLEHLPEHLPDSVELTMRAGDFFPYRLRYLRAVAPETQFEKLVRKVYATPVTVRPVPEVMVHMELYEVRFQDPHPASLFTYQPGPEVPVIDGTAEYLSRLGLAVPP